MISKGPAVCTYKSKKGTNVVKACHLAVILAVSLIAVNAAALQAASNNSCSDCGDQPPRFELGVAGTGIHLSDNNNFGVGARAVYNFNSFFHWKVKETSFSTMRHQNSSAEDAR
jgi:hypothetical protein